MRILLSTVILLGLLPRPARAQTGAPTAASAAPIDSATLQAARSLLEIQHAGDVLISTVQGSVEQERANGGNAQIPPAFFDRFMTALRADAPNLMEQLAQVYARHFSKGELVQLTTFYQSPLGQRLAAESGPLGIESAEIGRRWGGALAMRVMGDMIQKGEYTPPTH